jgi:hypothetical protein
MSEPKVMIIAVQPVGREKSVAFVSGPNVSGFREVEMDVYPHSPRGEALRGCRMQGYLTIRDAAKRLGIRCVEYCDLERGKATLLDEDWEIALNVITKSDRSSSHDHAR